MNWHNRYADPNKYYVCNKQGNYLNLGDHF
jgi:hypothetical protein